MILLVIAQFACTSLWFAGNAVVGDLQAEFGFPSSVIGSITSSVQLGFICGTMIFALLTIADRFSPSRVFFVSALIGAMANLLIYAISENLFLILSFRFLTGFFLAGIYPVGMKIAADYNEQGLGKALGYLVGALVVGTAFPHLVRALFGGLPWRFVIISTSVTAMLGGLLVLFFVPDGPFRRRLAKVDLSLAVKVFFNKKLRASAFGYFGHMWELYTFWAFVPVIISFFYTHEQISSSIVSLMSFLTIALGGLACIAGGYLAGRIGSERTAYFSLLLSGACCLVSVFMYSFPTPLFYGFLFFWGMVVISDSPQFSTLVATYASHEERGTALTVVNSIGFAITIISIQLITWSRQWVDPQYVYLFLTPGPLLGLLAMRPILVSSSPTGTEE